MPIMMLMGNTFFHFKIFRESIINGGGEYVPLAGIFLRKLLRFCLSRLAIGSQNRTASGENSRCNKKAHPAFRQDARKIACGHFQANGINLVHFAPKSPVFCNFISWLRHKISWWASSWGFWSYVPYKASWCFDITCLLIKHPSNYAFISLRLLSICCHSMILLSFWVPHQSASSTIKKCPVLQPVFQKIPAFSAQSLQRRHP